VEAPEVHILTKQSWQLFGTFTFKEEEMSTARRFNMFFAWLRQAAKQFRVYFPGLPWCLRMEDGEMAGRRHFHFLLAGFPAHSIRKTARFWMMHKWEELGGGMARIRKFDPSLTGVDYVTKCLSGPDGGDLYELDKFGLKSCELTLSKALLVNAKRACDKRRLC
jgi:hypothetical protein